MAVFQLEIADEDVDRVFSAICSNYGWDNQGSETPGDFTHKIVRQFLSDNVAAYEIDKAKSEATDGLDTSVNLADPA